MRSILTDEKNWRKIGGLRQVEQRGQPARTNVCHAPADEVHSIENTGDKIVRNLLTGKLQSVQQTRSLTVSVVFWLVASPGLKRVHRSRACSA
jgi:hypothetical protein